MSTKKNTLQLPPQFHSTSTSESESETNTRKANGSKSLRLNCSDITQLNLKMLTTVIARTLCKKD